MPRQAGAALIRVTTYDGAFESVHERTVLLEQPRRLTVEPAAVRVAEREGIPLKANLKLRMDGLDRAPAYAGARLEKSLPGVRLLSSRLEGESLHLDFEARPGEHQGALVVQVSDPDAAVEPVVVPLELSVRARLSDLVLPREVGLGTVIAKDRVKGEAHVNENPQTNKDENASGEEVVRLLERAEKGDATVLPELRRLPNESPALWRGYGDLAAQARAAWVKLAAGSNGLMAECLEQKSVELRREVAGNSPSLLEQLLADRVVVCWLQVRFYDGVIAQTSESSSARLGELQKHH